LLHADQIVSVLLAAGRSRRFGFDDKLLADLNGLPLVLHAARLIVDLDPARRIAVCSPAVGALLEPLGFELILTDDAEQEMSASLALGIKAASTDSYEAALITLGDMPFVKVEHLQQLLARWDSRFAPVVGSTKHGIPMPPAIFARSEFPDLCQTTGDRGARKLLLNAALVEPPPEQLADVDTIDDLLRLRTPR
jgi:molybdenum cofactor cytidylyltransferase